MNRLLGYIQLTRPVNALLTFLSVFIGGFVTGSVQPITNLLLACLSAMLLCGGGNCINDCFDLDIDRINKPGRPLPSGIVTLKQARIFSWILFGFGIGLSFFISIPCIMIAAGSTCLAYLYSRNLKGTVLWGNLEVAALTGLAFIYGGLAIDRLQQPLVVGIFAFFFHLAREIMKDVEDMEGDAKQGIQTFPIVFGVKHSVVLATWILCILIALTFVPYLLHMFSITYLIVVFIGVDLFLMIIMVSMWSQQKPKHIGRLAQWMKADMLLGLLAVYLG